MIRTASPLRFVPAGAVKVADKASDAVAFVYTNAAGKPCARVFFGRQSKPVLAAAYRSTAHRDEGVRVMFLSRQASLASKAKLKADRKASALKCSVGDILSTCWGYDQTNREFYEVVRVKGASVTVRQIATETVATGSMTARVIPLPGHFVGEEMTRRVSGSSLRISGCQRAFPHEFETVAGVKVYRAVGVSSYA